MKNLKVYNKIFSLILVGTIFCGSLTGCGVKAKEVENQDNAESKETTASENANILEVETILMKDGSYVTFPGKIDGDRKDIFTEIVLPNEQAILSTGHNLINVEKKTDGVTAEDFIKALYNDEETNQLKDYDGDRSYEELPKIQGTIKNGADEIDMVINVGWLKDKKYDDILNEINAIKDACNGKILKVIIETCLLTDEEKIKMCEIVSNSNADFIKTSTGFSTGGATKTDIELFAKHTTNGKKIKAAGGIASIEDAEEFINLGASRLGTSRIVKIVKNEQGSGY